MQQGPPPEIGSQLFEPDSWISNEAGDVRKPESGHQRLLRSLWAISSLGDRTREVGLALTRSNRIAIQFHQGLGARSWITISDSLIRAIDGYMRARVAYVSADRPNQSSSEVQRDALEAVRSMAWFYRHRGLVRVRRVSLAETLAASASADAAVASSFLLAHELGHLPGSAATSCLDVEAAHADEFAADQAAADFMLASPPATPAGPAVRALFELLELLEFGVPSADLTHPLAMSRLAAVLGTLDPDEQQSLFDDLFLGREGFWFLR